MAVRLDSIADKSVRLDTVEQSVRLDSIGHIGDIPHAPGMQIADPKDIIAGPVAGLEDKPPQVMVNPIPGTVLPTPDLPSQYIGPMPDKSNQVFSDERLLAEMSGADRHEAFLKSPIGKALGLEATRYDKDAEQMLGRALGRTAYLGTKLATGLTLNVAELAFGPDLAERVHKSIVGFEMLPDEKHIGEMVEFVAGLKTAGMLMKPLASMIPAREGVRLMTGGGATFMLRNLSTQTVDKLRKGESIDGNELLAETFIGVAFGGLQHGVRQLGRKFKGTYAEWAKSIVPKYTQQMKHMRSSAIGKSIPNRLWMRADEGMRAIAEGMPKETWAKVYGKDAYNLAKAYADAAQASPQISGAIAGKPFSDADTTWTTHGYQPLARRGDVRAPVRKGLQPGVTERMAQLMKEADKAFIAKDVVKLRQIEEAAKSLAPALEDMLNEEDTLSEWVHLPEVEAAGKIHALRYELERIADPRGRWLSEDVVDMGILTQEEADDWNKEIAAKKAAIVPDILRKYKTEPHLFQTTQLMKRVPTPGEIQPPRRVLIPQSTALATAKKWERTKRVVGPSGKVIIPQSTAIEKSAFRKWVTDYSSSRALDIGMPVVPKDPDMATSRLETLNSMAKSQKRHEAKRQAAIDKSTGKPNYLNPWVSSRFMFMDFEERTGVPVYHTVENIFSKSGRASLDGYNLISDSIRLNELAGLTPLDNEHIAKYLFSPETRKDIEVDISPEALTVASRLEDILQGEAAKDVQEMVFRLWDTTGKMPPDVKQYGDPKTILRHGREAKAEGRLKEWIAEQSPWGVRRFYYMSDPMKQDAIDNYMEVMGRSALHAPGTSGAGMPGTFAYEAHVRKGKPPIKEGSVVTNILTHVQRVKIANAVADDLNQLYERLGSVDLTERDKRVVKQVMDNVMMRRQPVDAPFEILAQMRRMYWRPTMSYLWRPHTALWRSLRNSLQNYAFGPFAINLKEAGKVGADVAAKRLQGIHLEQYDPEMMKRHEAVFASYVSQRQAYYHEFLLQDTANITKDFSRRGTARKAIAMMEKTGGLYGAVDEYVNRFPIWVTQYQITKRAATDYASGKINKQQFFRRTNLESVQKPQQMLVQDLLSEGRVDDLAEVSANWITEDVNFKYKTPERAGVEQTMAERSLMGIYTFPRGQVELIYRRGIKTMLQGAENKNVNQAYAGASNVIKGLMSSSAASALLYGYAGRRAYETYNALAYTMLDPGTGTMYDLLSWNWEQMMRYNNKEQSLLTTIDNIAEAWAKVGETLLIPLSVEIESWYEANNDVAGVTLYRLIRNGVAAKLGIEEKAFNKVTRTQKQAVLHTLLGSYEYPPKEPPTGREGRSGRGSRGTR